MSNCVVTFPLVSLVRCGALCLFLTLKLCHCNGQVKKGLQYLKDSPYSTEVQLEISDLPFVQNKDYQYQSSIYIEVELMLQTNLLDNCQKETT